MSILAKIHYEELIINIVSFNVCFDQRSDATGRPSQRTLGGLWEITFETRKNDPFLEYMVNESMIPYLKIVIQPAVLGSRSRTIEIRDVYVLAYRGNFNGIDNQPMVTYIELSPASMVQNGQIIFVKKWKITDPDAKVVEATKLNIGEPQGSQSGPQTAKTSTKQSNPCQNLPTLIKLRTGAMDVARSEAWDWTDKGLIESNPDALAKLKDYYLAAIDRTPYQINRSYEEAKTDADGRAEGASKGDKFWSAAFISYCYVKAYKNLNPNVDGWTLRDYAKCLRDNNLFNADVAHETYVDSALGFPGPVYKMVSHTDEPVEVGDWIYKKRDGGTHVDIVLEIFETKEIKTGTETGTGTGTETETGTKDGTNNLITRKWALAAGGNISKESEQSKEGLTAGFKIYYLYADGKLMTDDTHNYRPSNNKLYKEIKLNLNQICSWPIGNRMIGLVRLAPSV